MLTDLQKRKLAHLFTVMDANGNGRLEWADYERIAANMAETRGWEPGSERYDELMVSDCLDGADVGFSYLRSPLSWATRQFHSAAPTVQTCQRIRVVRPAPMAARQSR